MEVEADINDLIRYVFTTYGERFSGGFWTRLIIISLSYERDFDITFKNWQIITFYGTVKIRSINGQEINEATRNFIRKRSDLAGKVIITKIGGYIVFSPNQNGKH